MTDTRSAAGRSPINEWLPLAVLAGIAAVVWTAPSVAARVWSSTGWHPGRDLGSLATAYAHLFDPEQIAGSGLHGILFGATTVAVAVVLVGAGAFAAGQVQRRRRAALRGLAYGAELDRFSPKAIVAASDVILGRHERDPRQAGLMVGRDVHTGREIWLPKESTVLVLAPPRSGKTSGTVAPAIVDHHGPVVATGVRRDIMDWTHPWRAATGAPMWRCEPMLPPGTVLPAGVETVRWSPLSGCESMLTAKLRAEALFAALPAASADDQFWRNAGQTILSCYLMAAAARDGSIRDVLGWADRDSDRSPADVLRAAADEIDDPIERDTVNSVAAQVEAAVAQDPRYKAGVTGQALQALEPFRLPHIRRMCDVPIGESFDPAEFLRASGTIWMLGSESHQRQAAGVCTALTAAVVETARELGREQGRLRPPLLLALDEAVNVAPIPRLEQLLSTGGGSGIQTIVVLQSLAAARNAWGREMGDALLDFNNAKVVLGGLSDAQDLADLSALLGQREERVVQTSRSGRLGVLDVGDHSWSWRQVPVMRPDEIRRIDSERRGHALLIARSGSGILLRQDRIFTRRPPNEATP
ncbi:MAG TPA: type IV secretory system conjugative DNA transfer family protein [Ilumatobacter sp.]|nr:type IV secretory system conjugative DNA transfer family protein [Ilumatobacter sp.]